MTKVKEFAVCDMKEEEGQATVHGVVVDVSPIQTSRKNSDIRYFSGKMSDSRKIVRVICFDPKLGPAMEKSLEEKKPVVLVNCKVKTGKFSFPLEFMTSQAMRSENSPKRFKIEEEPMNACVREALTVEDTTSSTVTQQISVQGKEVKVGEIVNSCSKRREYHLKKQDCIIADSSSHSRIVFWEADVWRLQEGKSYRLERVTCMVNECGC